MLIKEDKTCNPHPDAPHGFNRNASHYANRYVCDCEGWMPGTNDREAALRIAGATGPLGDPEVSGAAHGVPAVRGGEQT